MQIYDVIIIGAGVAGLSASKTLLESGIENFIILEAKDKPGGRIQTVSTGDSNIELGAQWIHGQENDFFQLAKDSGSIHGQLSWEAKGIFLTPSGEKVSDNLVQEILEWVDETLEHVENTFSIETFQESPNNFASSTSVGSFLRQSFEKYLLETQCQDVEGTDYQLKMALFQWAMNFQRIDNSCYRMTDLSLFRWSEFKINGGDLHHNFKSGADAFIQEAFCESIHSSHLKLNTEVTKILWKTENNLVQVETASGETFASRTALITVSIGVLQATNNSLFEPALPVTLSSAIQSTGFGPVTKIYLEWDIPWWSQLSETPFEGIQLVWPKEYVNCCDTLESAEPASSQASNFSQWSKVITGFDPVLNNPNVLLAWIGGEEAITVENLEPVEISLECRRVLETFTRVSIPSPKAVHISKWNSDPFIRGAYCFRSTQGDQIPGDISRVLSTPVYSKSGNPVLIFAGEANHRTQYSTLHGAFDSGKTQAQVLVQYFQEILNLNHQKL